MESKKPELTETGCRGPGVGQMGDVGQRVETSSYKMKKFWESNVQQDDYLTVLYYIYIIYRNLKVAKRVNIVCSCHTKMLIL